MRLIDFDDLIPSEEHTIVVRRADGTGVWASAEQITNAPTIDDVEVLRCKDCIYYDDENHFCAYIIWAKPDGYCSGGKRREYETN